MFIQPCFIIKNTPELRWYLEGLGYKLNNGTVFGRYLVCFKTKDIGDCRFVGSPLWDLPNMPEYKDAIYCGSNEKLFKAIAALRDDSDYLQWFTYRNQWYLCEMDSWVEMFSVLSMGKKFSDNVERDNWVTYLTFFHKATVEELIEKFK